GLRQIPFRKIYSSQIFRVMRLTVLFMILGTFLLRVKSYSQHVSYACSNVSLEDALKEFSRQIGYYLFYKHNEIKGFKVTHIKTSRTNLEQAMQLLLKGLPFDFNLKEKTIIVNKIHQTKNQSESYVAPVQQRPISGVVRNEKGEVLSGATVAI